MAQLASVAPAADDRYQSGRELANAISSFATSINLDLSQETQAGRLNKLLGSLIEQRNKELDRLQVHDSPAPSIEAAPLAPPENDVDIIYMQLPSIPLRLCLFAVAAVLTTVLFLF